MKNSQAIVSEKGQVTIPKKIRESLGLKTGQVLEFTSKNGQLVARKQARFDQLQEVVGLLKGQVPDIDDYLKRTRGRP